MTNIRPIREGDPTPDADFATQCHRIVDALIAKGAAAMVFLADNGEQMEIKSAPRSFLLEVGAVRVAYDAQREMAGGDED